VLIEPGETFAGLKRFFDRPSLSRDSHQDAQRNRFGCSPVVRLRRISIHRCPSGWSVSMSI
jgi:hypothetical protein